MFIRRIAFVLPCLFSLAELLSAQTNRKVDFRQDVQPLIEKNCIACHGPEQQMNAFRLDRRSAAMRGGTRSVIVPGNSSASRLYLRLVGDHFGRRMPAGGTLAPEEIAIFKAWIDQGAQWPDELANEPVSTPPDPKATLLIESLRTGNPQAFRAQLAADPRAINLRGVGGATPFLFAVLYGDASTVKELLEKGAADPNKRNDANATALMWASNNLEKTRSLLLHGADANVISADGRTALTIAAAQPGNSAVVKLLLEHGANPNPKRRSAGDTTPLREAAMAGDAESMNLLIARGADIKAAGAGALTGAVEANCWKCVDLVAKSMDAGAFTSTLLSVVVYGDTNAVRYLLDHGANVNVSDVTGRTPLMYACNNDRLPLDTVKLLVEHGADLNAKSTDGITALDSAKLHGHTPIVDLLEKAGAASHPVASPALTFQQNNTVSAAVQRALPLIQKADLNFTRKSGCVSCHNEALTDMAISLARSKGFRVDEQMAKQEVKAVVSFFGEWRERMLQGVAPGGPAYILQGLHAEGYKSDLITDSVARYLKTHQFTDGHWGVGCGGSRNPLCGDEVTNTANSLRALQFYAPATGKEEYQESIRLAAKWLSNAKVYTHEDRTFRVFGLAWADGDKAVLKTAVHDLMATQRGDGGWSDNPYMPSTSYSTGEALVALHEAGTPLTDPAWKRGIQFLLKTQVTDGSWYVQSHSYGTQPYFDNEFPHGLDQWISAAGTNWAVMALALSAPPAAPIQAANGIHSGLN